MRFVTIWLSCLDSLFQTVGTEGEIVGTGGLDQGGVDTASILPLLAVGGN
jgi:hypothetical protein